jgi:hypothetical protein
VAGVIRIEEVWLAVGASDLRGGIDSLLGQVIARFGAAQPHPDHQRTTGSLDAYRGSWCVSSWTPI